MLYQKEITFKFKGNRDYVHGTDIFDKVLKNIRLFLNNYPTKINGSYHSLLKSNGILRIYNYKEAVDRENLSALFSIQADAASFLITITSSNSTITSSYHYDEADVLYKSSIDNDSIKMIVKSSYTYIEQIVAMTKKLHLTFYPNAKKNWLFTKIEIEDLLDPSLYPNNQILIKAMRNFHYKLTQSSIFLDDRLVGNIWFSQAL
jgi:hypothetical protein